MSMFYGNYELQLESGTQNRFTNALANRVMRKLGYGLSGQTLFTVEEIKHHTTAGYFIIGNDSKTEVIGAGYLSGNSERIWIYLDTRNKTQLFLDGPGTAVEFLWLKFDPSDNSIKSPIDDRSLTMLA